MIFVVSREVNVLTKIEKRKKRQKLRGFRAHVKIASRIVSYRKWQKVSVDDRPKSAAVSVARNTSSYNSRSGTSVVENGENCSSNS